MNNYQSPETIEVGRADESILGSKLGVEFDEAERDYTQPPATIVDQD